ncbi:class I SAM-dependent methyltransferase [Sphingosinithalassobacter sp. LHW66-3]|uniref:class I SAM-dependent methyltransferase n=1 Tax=Sphingosinithalassobacter sp. LHW66-3 TaxID=3424718 RepID=UPI003D6B5ACB
MTSREATSYLPLSDDALWPADVERTASDWAHVLAFGAIGWPWLARSLSGGSKRAKRELLERLDLAPDALPNLGSWKADTGFLTLIVDHILERKPETVVELGAGASSLVIGKALQKSSGSGQLISCDQHADFVAATHEWLRENGVEADLRATPLRRPPGDWPGVWYDHGPLPPQIDLLIVDGPPWTIHPYVRGAAESLFDRMPVGGTVMLDDAARPGERVVARRWRRRWPNFEFELVNKGTKGTLIGTRLR